MLSCHDPPRAVRTPRSFNAATMARNVVAPVACIWRTIGSTLAANASAAARLLLALRLCVGQIGPVPQEGAMDFFLRQRPEGRLGNQLPASSRQDRLNVDHEGVGVGPRLRDDERHP